MATLVTAEIQGQTAQGYDAMLGELGPLIRQAPGFIAHMAHPIEGDRWRVLELWESKAASDRFFAAFVVPRLPPGVHPKRSYQELHSFLCEPKAAQAASEART
jgi:hypothetical protein